MQPLIELNQVDFSIRPEKKIIDQLSLSVYPGDFLIVLGGNGSGKSTLMKLMSGIYKPTQGHIRLKNKEHIVSLSQFIADSLFLELTVEENAILIESAHCSVTNSRFSRKQFVSALPVYLQEFHPNISRALKQSVKSLSGGEQQLLAFALYLRHQPDLLLLDEHTSALDPKKSTVVMEIANQYILKNQLTCLMTTHQLNDALKYGNRLIALSEGKIVFEANQQEKAKLTMVDLLKYCY